MKLPDFRKTIRIRIQTEKVCPKKPNLKKTQKISGRKQRIMKNLIVLKKPVFLLYHPIQPTRIRQSRQKKATETKTKKPCWVNLSDGKIRTEGIFRPPLQKAKHKREIKNRKRQVLHHTFQRPTGQMHLKKRSRQSNRINENLLLLFFDAIILIQSHVYHVIITRRLIQWLTKFPKNASAVAPVPLNVPFPRSAKVTESMKSIPKPVLNAVPALKPARLALPLRPD